MAALSTQALQEVGKWQRFEAAFDNPSWEGHPLDLEFEGAFTSPSGRTLKQWGFYEGGEMWKLYFMPDELGVWTFRTVCQDEDLNGQTGRFVCVESGLPGKLTAQGNRWVLTDRGVDFPVIWQPTVASGEHWGFRAAAADDPDVKEAIHTARNVAAARLLGFYELLIVPTGWASAWPQDAVPYQVGQEGDGFHAAFWDELNAKLDHARDGGMGQYIMLYSDDELTPDRFGLTPRSQKELRFFRYVVARLACYPVVLWDSGIDISEYRDRDWVNWFAEWFSDNDPWHHPVSSRAGGGSGDDLPKAATYLSVGGAELPSRAELLTLYGKGRPVAHTDHWRPFISRGNWDHDKIRAACWRCALSGGQALFPDYNQGPVRVDEVPVGAQYVGVASRFFRQRIRLGLEGLVPRDERILSGEGAILAANPGLEYVLYDEDGGTVKIDLSGATAPLTGVWVNPRTGDKEEAGVFSPGAHSIVSPTEGASEDWVLHLFLVLATASTRSFRAEDFGAIPGSSDAGPGLRKALAQAGSIDGLSEVLLEEGTYLVGSEKEGSYALDLKGAHDIVLRGVPGKTVLCMKDPQRGALRFQDCDRVTVRGIVIDYDPPPYCQGAVRDVNLQEDTFDLEPEAGFLSPNHPAFEEAKAQWGLVVRGDKEGNPTQFGPVAIPARVASSPSQGVWRMKVGGGDTGYLNPLKNSGMKAGDKVVHLARTYDAAVFLHRCDRVFLQDVTVHASPGAAFCPLLCGRVEVVDCHVRLHPSSNRWLSTDADGIHCRGVREGILVDQCSFEGMADDAINIHSSPIPVLDALSPTELVVQKLHYTLEEGDLVQVMDSEACQSRGEATALELEELPDRWAYRLVLDKPVTGIRTGQNFAVSDNLYNLSEAGTGSVVRGSHFKSFRGRGVLLSCHGCLVERNIFEVREGWGVVLFHESTRWAEGPLARDIEIKDNVFRGRGGSQPAILAMAVKRDGRISRSREMRNLTITGNRFLDLEAPAILLNACSDVLIRDNLLIHSPSMTRALSPEASLVLNDCDGVKMDEAWKTPVVGGEKPECGLLDRTTDPISPASSIP